MVNVRTLETELYSVSVSMKEKRLIELTAWVELTYTHTLLHKYTHFTTQIHTLHYTKTHTAHTHCLFRNRSDLSACLLDNVLDCSMEHCTCVCVCVCVCVK